MKVFWVIFAMVLLALPSFAHAEGNIGFTFNQVVDDRSMGFTAGYKTDGEKVDFEVDGQLQAGEIYRGGGHAEIVFGLGAVGIKPFVDVTTKGYTLEGLGSDQNIGLALTVPVGDLSFDVGVGGKSSNPWGAPNALDDLVPKGYNEDELDALGLRNVHPSKKGIPFKDGNSVNVFIATEFEKANIEINLKGLLEVAGEGEKAHQFNSRFQTRRKVLGTVDLTVAFEIAGQLYQNEIQYETAVFTTWGLNF